MCENQRDSKPVYDLLDGIRISDEFYLIKRLYGVLFLQVFVTTFYPELIFGAESAPSLVTRLLKGSILFVLAWRAMRFQLVELWTFPEGVFGRFYSVLLPAFFIVGVYFSHDPRTSSVWPFFVAGVVLFYLFKPLTLRIRLKNHCTYFIDKLGPEDDTLRHNPLWNWTRNTFWLFLGYLLYGLILVILHFTGPEVQDWLIADCGFFGEAHWGDAFAAIATIGLILWYTYSSGSHYFEDYADAIDKSLLKEVTVNRWLVKQARRTR